MIEAPTNEFCMVRKELLSLDLNDLEASSLYIEEMINEGKTLNKDEERYLINESAKFGNYFIFAIFKNSEYKTKEVYTILEERIIERINSLKELNDSALNSMLEGIHIKIISGLQEEVESEILKNENNRFFDLFTQIAMVEYLLKNLSFDE